MVEIPIYVFVIACLLCVVLGSAITLNIVTKTIDTVYALSKEDKENDQK